MGYYRFVKIILFIDTLLAIYRLKTEEN